MQSDKKNADQQRNHSEMYIKPDFTKNDLGMMLNNNQAPQIIDDNSSVGQNESNLGKVVVNTTNEAVSKAFIQIHDQQTSSATYERQSQKLTPTQENNNDQRIVHGNN